ncbi:hypothetical protein AURDEDRAFT_125328 [Auricularia subglabra TFB-10046 SS5]|nr:hypothetical protein AURDEDRAFT_125328 [Auricularia subglabra TFB-10046 SS5]
MPITFSSFGDIVAVLQLAWQLRGLLSAAGPASSEIRALLLDVESFTRALKQIHASIEKRDTPLAPAIENGIKHALIACHDALRRILSKVEAFKTQTTQTVSGRAWRQYWALAAWSILGGKQDVDALRTRLSEQIAVIQTYLSLAQSNDQTRVQAAVERQGTTLDALYSVMQDIQTRFDVGVPTFQFYDRYADGYYHPYARTSLLRFQELFSASSTQTLPVRLDDGTDRLLYVCGTRAESRASRKTMHAVTEQLVFGSTTERGSKEPWDNTSTLGLQCCFFRERAFNEWQVLVGVASSAYRHEFESEIMKLLLERKHSVGARCRCEVGLCRSRFLQLARRSRYWLLLRHAYALVNQMALQAVFLDDDAADRHFALCEGILDDLGRNTDPAKNSNCLFRVCNLGLARNALKLVGALCRF